MRSSLTRNVFKAIIANEPYCVTVHLRRLPKLRRDPLSPLIHTPSQRLSLLSLASTPATRTRIGSRKTPTKVGKATDVLVGLVRAKRDEAQLPPVQKIAQAFHIVLSSHNQAPARISRNEIYLLTEAFKYIQDNEAKNAEVAEALVSDTDLQQSLSALASSSGKEKFRTDSRTFAYMLFSELHGRRTAQGKGVEAPNSFEPSVVDNYIAVLSSTGGAREACDILRNSSDGDIQKRWLDVIKGLSSEGLEQDVWRALDQMKARTGNLSVEGHEMLTIHFAKNASTSATKKLYGQNIAGDGSPTVVSQLAMAELCIRNNDLSWGEPILTNLRSIPEDARVWDVVLVLSAARDTLNDIAATLDNLARVAAQSGIPGPSMSNVNSLIEYAFSVGNVQAVQSYISMGEERGLQPDARTCILQLDHEVRNGDLDSAALRFEDLSSYDPITDESDAAVLNRFLTALCFSSNPEYDLVMRTLDSILEENLYLEAEAISGLCKVFLQREELEEILELLRHRVDSYPHNDRARISQSFREFVIDQGVADQRAFNAYELFRVAFPEISIDDRLQIMHSFFTRKRPDLACLIFGHMRQREDPSARPTPDAYGQCFEGLAGCQDTEGLQMVYNMLKLDREVEPTTRVRNGLMAAYTACEQPFTAIIDHFWKILTSLEGPTLSSFALALRACETWVPQGAMEARKIIAVMQSWDLEITKEIYDCYIGAIAGQCEFENTIELIEEMENDIGVPADAFTIGTFYNAIPYQYRKDEVEAWAKHACPELWEELLTYGEVIDEEWEIRYFKIDRTINTSDEGIYQEGEYDPQIAQRSQILLEAPTP